MDMKLFTRVYFLLFALMAPLVNFAQCAMCRTQVVNNVSHGETSLAAGLNFGIIYLFVTPYIAIGIVAYFWFKKSKVNERKRPLASYIRR